MPGSVGSQSWTEVPGDRHWAAASGPCRLSPRQPTHFTWCLRRRPGQAVPTCPPRCGPAGAEGHGWPGRTTQRLGRGPWAGPPRWLAGCLGVGEREHTVRCFSGQPLSLAFSCSLPYTHRKCRRVHGPMVSGKEHTPRTSRMSTPEPLAPLSVISPPPLCRGSHTLTSNITHCLCLFFKQCSSWGPVALMVWGNRPHCCV